MNFVVWLNEMTLSGCGFCYRGGGCDCWTMTHVIGTLYGRTILVICDVVGRVERSDSRAIDSVVERALKKRNKLASGIVVA